MVTDRYTRDTLADGFYNAATLMAQDAREETLYLPVNPFALTYHD
jgi:hypothetical protein